MNHWFLIVPFLFQGFAISIDEFYFHYKRGLKNWELIGHPVDTLAALFCYLFLLIAPVSERGGWIYLGLALLSCALVTKDEWVHKEQCTSGEHWLHSVLFMSHPLALLASFYIWWTADAIAFIEIQATVVCLFLLYQVGYGIHAWRRSLEN